MANDVSKAVRVGSDAAPFEAWLDPADDTIHLSCSDSRLTDENGNKPGFHVVFSANPRSADYNPANFNRFARLLRAEGQPAPAEDASIKPRQLNRRSAVIAELIGEQAKSAATGRPADAVLLGWAVCPSCTAVVVDVAKHQTASPPC